MKKVILKEGMTVIAPCDGDTVKKGQEFVVKNVEKTNESYGYTFNTDVGELFCLLNKCNHLNGGSWIVKSENKKPFMKPLTQITICTLCACFIIGIQEFYFHYEKYTDLCIYAMICLLVLLVLAGKKILKD